MYMYVRVVLSIVIHLKITIINSCYTSVNVTRQLRRTEAKCAGYIILYLVLIIDVIKFYVCTFQSFVLTCIFYCFFFIITVLFDSLKCV